MFSNKPPACSGCPLHHLGTGFALPSGPPTSPLAFMGEALGREEAFKSEPFVGAAGQLLNRAFRMVGIERSSVYVFNSVQCFPDNLSGAPYEEQALQHCDARHVQPAIERWLQAQHENPNPVLVTLGGVPLRQALHLTKGSAHSGGGGGRVQDFHGTVHRSSCDRYWIVPTYHPSHIQRGAFNLLNVLRFDLEVALEVARGQFSPQPIDTILDPPVEWFSRWADNYLEAVSQDPSIWLAVDIETPDKAKKLDEGELTSKDRDFHILRVNLSCNVDEGVTVPFSGPYTTTLQRVLGSTTAPKVFWHCKYDVPRLEAAGAHVSGVIYDAMEMWHKLQSDLPRGLGFAAPFYSRYGAWKHLAHSEPVFYAALDGPQTLRCAHGIASDLMREGMWEVPFIRHVCMLDQLVLGPMEEVGLPVNRGRLENLKVETQRAREELDAKLQALFPEELKPRVPKAGLSKHPKLEDGSLEPNVEEKREKRIVRACSTCGESEVPAKHRCKDRETGKPSKTLVASTSMQELVVSRFYRIEEFSPGSWQQVLAYILYRKHKPGKNKKTKKPTTDKQTIDRLARTTKDPLYKTLLTRRAVSKIESTYVDGSLQRLDGDPRSIEDKRLHGSTTHKPSTQRLSMQNPNLTNVVVREQTSQEIDKSLVSQLPAKFRHTVEASAGCMLIEADFSGIEAVLTGWFMGDPDYIWWAHRGVHALVTAHLLHQQGIVDRVPDRHTWPEEEIVKFLKHIKKAHEGPYNQCKRCVHGNNYGLTVRGMALQFPDEFPTVKAAKEIQDIYYKVAPGLPRWHEQIRQRAAKQGYLGGPGDHPFGYKHWFFNVLGYRPVPAGAHNSDYPVVRMGNKNFFVTLGEDAKRCVAFFPQSTAAGIIKETMLRLFADRDHPSYIGDLFYGRTPLRAPIHDSLLLEVPIPKVDYAVEKLVIEMTRPIRELPCPPEWGLGSHLSIGVEVKVGTNWAGYNEDPARGFVNPDGMRVLEASQLPSREVVELAHSHDSFTALPQFSLAADTIVPLDEYDESLDEDDLAAIAAQREVV